MEYVASYDAARHRPSVAAVAPRRAAVGIALPWTPRTRATAGPRCAWFGRSGQAGDEVGAIRVVAEERGPLNPPEHGVVEDVGGIEPGLARHGTGGGSASRHRIQRTYVPGLERGTTVMGDADRRARNMGRAWNYAFPCTWILH
jgi:hypothetical protein